jgi:hypothetical protein
LFKNGRWYRNRINEEEMNGLRRKAIHCSSRIIQCVAVIFGRRAYAKASVVLVQFHITSSNFLLQDFTTQRKKLGERKAIYIPIV